MDPDMIYFTHARVRSVFTGCNKRIEETLAEIEAGTTRVQDIPYITVIENFEAAPAAEEGNANGKGKGKGSKAGGKGAKPKKGRRRGDATDSSDDDAPPARSQPATSDAQPYYFSLNNRRLFLFKTLKARGLIDTVPVQVKPALERERVKYTRERCVLRAKLMGAGQRPVGEEAEAEAEEDDDDDGSDEDE
jgi:hypothetical protein